MYAKRVDANQKEIVAALRKMGADVYDLSKVGNGIPDLMVTTQGQTILVEVKSSEKAKYTDHQLKYLSNWKGGLVVRVNSVDDAINLLQSLNK